MAADPALDNTLFSSRTPERTPVSPLPWIIAAAVILVIIVLLLVAGHHKAAPLNVALPLDPYASSIVIGNIEMSESTSLSGGKSTYIDGHIRNAGTKTITAATVQVVFANDEALPPQIETLPLTLIRTRQPAVDTQPIAANPIAPGEDREFRLIFEDIGANWNGQVPEIRPVSVKIGDTQATPRPSHKSSRPYARIDCTLCCSGQSSLCLSPVIPVSLSSQPLWHVNCS